MRTYVIQIQTAQYNNILREMCEHSKRLYNSALYELRQFSKANGGKQMSYAALDKHMRQTRKSVYYRLNSAATQDILRVLDAARKGFFARLKKGESFKQNKPPKYIKDKGLFSVYLNQRSFRVTNHILKITISKYFRNRHNGERFLEFPFPKHLEDVCIKQIEIKPLGYSRFELHFKYEEKEVKQVATKQKKYLSIDLGLDNLVSAISSEGDAFLISGKTLKAANQLYNKKVSKIQSQVDTEKHLLKKFKLKDKIFNTTQRRKRFVKDYLHKVSFQIVQYCVSNKINNIVIGYNKSWKSKINIGRKNNQKFVQIPHSKLIKYIKYKAEPYGIEFNTIEESYTSKCDSLALETIEKHTKYLGRRVKRGLFVSSLGKALNADINAAINILRKFLKRKNESSFLKKIVSSGHVFCPWHLAVT